MDSYRVLYVDDDPSMCRAFGRTLEGVGCSVHCVSEAEEALVALSERSYHVIAADHCMPRMTGLDLLQRARDVAPETRRVLVSGRLDLPLAVEAINRAGVDWLILKPWCSAELRQIISAAVRSSRSDALEQLCGVLMDSLVRALDLRDSETQWHSRRVAAYARHLGMVVGLRGQALRDVERGALLHDIGKIGISDQILLKPGRLTEAEWAEMRRHPILGYELLQHVDFLTQARQIVLQHQERWDGLGYPAGLRGEQICIGARIFQIVDAYDAITSDRPYRAAQDYAFARAEIMRCAGTQFDPELVRAWCSIEEQVWHGLRQKVCAERATLVTAAATPL
ncbi:MAG: HD domain-containing protein [Myxococcales bacterium]|nr:HD domain-containing protein [Myxococcota bacterium]MDW8281694.1 HD domain-containing protein [Myxococcales bacterium]